MRSDFKPFDTTKTYLVTGAAGFIGFHLCRRLLSLGCKVIGFDNLNDYYDVSLKQARLDQLASIASSLSFLSSSSSSSVSSLPASSPSSGSFTFVEGDLADKTAVDNLFSLYSPSVVVNLAAQAGVRYSIDNPYAYLQSNLVGFLNILEACRHTHVSHLVYASSSSVYGMNSKIPFSTSDKVDNPVSLYAATKKSNELMAHSYTHLYGIPSTGLRFFTVYGPYGRPDMAYFSFSKKIMAGEPIKIFNNGDMYRDFTYIDDIVQGMENILCNPPVPNEHGDRYKIYNIGNNKPEKLMFFIETLEQCLGKEAKKEFLPMQPGDVYQTYADVSDLIADFDFKPSTPLSLGLASFVAWFKSYYK
ncbi:NAD-dependent epimerase/dehydratase family protein [uncultured Sphaerochaeta sp.]|uniref:NAD-dependent epimerase/dehydratase family protein n=1 Tax=uncultured Sphaerochaeta sp. TaxID=886478 RepID=UPI002A0A9D8C|nr:NAD-dependent epimerase/dehydratase family protein [uncultured Sphaerochaeta sp.]